ncbi:MAG: hypothetical protein RLZZ435_1052, partial [Cyanobacteriota bacterium]
MTPHSLGKPIKWKQCSRSIRLLAFHRHLPTRWGNQLNG